MSFCMNVTLESPLWDVIWQLDREVLTEVVNEVTDASLSARMRESIMGKRIVTICNKNKTTASLRNAILGYPEEAKLCRIAYFCHFLCYLHCERFSGDGVHHCTQVKHIFHHNYSRLHHIGYPNNVLVQLIAFIILITIAP